jgi:nucleotide-binding universal stress UspA family protein
LTGQCDEPFTSRNIMNTLSFAADRLESETFPIRLTSPGTLDATDAAAALPELPSLHLRTILAPFDFSDGSAALLRRLITLAENSNATVHVLHVVEPTGGSVANEGTPIYPGARAAAARMQIKQWVAQTFSTTVAITTTVRVGRAADEIVAQAHALAADLIVMSAHSGSGRKNVLLRTTTERVVRQSPCPVLVVARDHVPEFLNEPDAFPLRTWKRILLPVDFSSGVGEALAYAAAIARENGARLHILHGVNADTLGVNETHLSADERLAAWLGSELRWPVEYEAVLWSNVPLLNAILHEIERSKIDLLVLPARDGTWFRRHRLWSITDGILRHAPCPVLSVNQRATTATGGIEKPIEQLLTHRVGH